MGPELAPLAYATLFAPLVAAGLAGLLFRRSRALSAGAAVLGMAGGLACTLVLMARSLAAPGGAATGFQHDFTWIAAGTFTVEFGVVVDRLSLLMALVVTGVGTPIFVYSIGYMKGDEGWGRYFACLSLFAFSMLGIVFSPNFLQTFMFWELVGLSSYLLIGFWFGKDSAVEAGKKAFMVNRVGDFGFLVGILLLHFAVTAIPSFKGNGFDFADLASFYRSGDGSAGAPRGFGLLPAGVGALAAVLVFCGAVGKSAQFPLHVWLPDAMEGPTPVSALMHAATMVAAGVYMICRTFFLFEPFPDALTVVAWIGGITALLAATIAVVQTDIKKVLAYSTLSQLGYMVMAVGLAGATAGMFHLTTHAFFKALLFLGSGSVIHACHTQEITGMGGLRRVARITYATWMVGFLALAGIPPFAGFFSKDEILAAAAYGPRHASLPLLVLGLATACLTAFYMTRCTVLAFHGTYRGHGHPHESPAVMTGPLVFLAVPALLVGLLGFPPLFHGHPFFQVEFGVLGTVAHEGPHAFHYGLAAAGTAAALLGIGAGALVYGRRTPDPDALAARFRPLHTLLVRKYYFDELYLWLVRVVQQGVAEVSNFFEQNVLIRGAVDGISAGTKASGRALRELQTGSLQTYVRFALAGTVVVVAWVLFLASGGER